jgi:hypothetical protein
MLCVSPYVQPNYQLWNITQDATILEETSTSDSSQTSRQDRLGFELMSPVFTLNRVADPRFMRSGVLVPSYLAFSRQ